MPCHFSGVFYLSSIYNRSLTCHFISDDPDTSQTVNMTYYAPSITKRDGRFHEPEPAHPEKVHFITGIMAIENSNYTAPLVNHLYIVTTNLQLVSSSSCFELPYYTEDLQSTNQNQVDDIILNGRLQTTLITITVTAKVAMKPVVMSQTNYTWKWVDLEVQQYLGKQMHVSNFICTANCSHLLDLLYERLLQYNTTKYRKNGTDS